MNVTPKNRKCRTCVTQLNEISASNWTGFSVTRLTPERHQDDGWRLPSEVEPSTDPASLEGQQATKKTAPDEAPFSFSGSIFRMRQP